MEILLRFKGKFKFLYIYVGILCANIFGINGFEYYAKKPIYWESCKIYQPEFTKCSTELAQNLIGRVIKGEFPEITQKLGPLDPMKLDRIIFKPDNNQAVTLEADLDDLSFKGLSNMVIKEARVSKKDFSWLTKIFLPKAHLDGKYDMKGKILLMPINGAGKFVFDIDNLNILMRVKTHLYEKDNLTFYNVTNVNVELNMTGLYTHFDNLFNGKNNEIAESTNQFFNDNWRDLFEALRPMVTETVENILLKILKQCFDVFPASFLIEDIPTSDELYNKNKSN